MASHAPGRRSPLRAVLRSERGAAAVEFALVVPVLVLLLVGIIEFSKVFNAQATLSAAAREGARVMAVSNDAAGARTAVRTAVGGLALTGVTVSPASCTDPASTVTVTITYRQVFAFGFLDRAGVDLTGRAVMRCGG